jgi:hypothetical protein
MISNVLHNATHKKMGLFSCNTEWFLALALALGIRNWIVHQIGP